MSETTTMRLTPELRDRLKLAAEEDGRTMGAELSALLDQREEEQFWAQARSAYARLQANPEEWAGDRAESQEWERASLVDFASRVAGGEID